MVTPLLEKMKEIEGTERAIAGPSGMGINSQTCLALLKPGDQVLAHRCNYDWAMTLFQQYLPSWGVEVEFLDFTNPDNLAAALNAKPRHLNGFGGMLGVQWKNESVHQRLGRHVRLIVEQTSLGDPVTRINNGEKIIDARGSSAPMSPSRTRARPGSRWSP